MRRRIAACLIAMILSVAAGANAAPAVIHSGNRVLATGDSITARRWAEAVGGLFDTLDARAAHVGATLANGSVQATLANGATPSQVRGFSTINTGVNGNKTSDIAADVAGRITQYSPDVIILLIGVNDVGGRIDPATVTANMTTILSSIRAWSSTVQIAVVSVLCFGEGWTAGPPLAWNNGVTDSSYLEQYNASYQTLCGTYNCTYVDIRTPLLAIEPTINPGAANQAFTIDGVHPIIQASEVTMGTWAAPYFTVTTP